MDSLQQRPELPLVRPADQAPGHGDADGGGGFSWLTALGFMFLTFNSGMAICCSDRDTGAIVFVAFSYLGLLLLFFSLRKFGGAPPGSTRRDRLKAYVWMLTTLLTLDFAYQVMGMVRLTLPMVLLVWAIAAATGIGAFHAFFQKDRFNPTPDETMRPLV